MDEKSLTSKNPSADVVEDMDTASGAETVGPPDQTQSHDNEKYKIYLIGLPEITNEELQSYFICFGNVADVSVRLSVNNEPMGFGYVVFKDEISYDNCAQKQCLYIKKKKVLLQKGLSSANSESVKQGRSGGESLEQERKSYPEKLEMKRVHPDDVLPIRSFIGQNPQIARPQAYRIPNLAQPSSFPPAGRSLSSPRSPQHHTPPHRSPAHSPSIGDVFQYSLSPRKQVTSQRSPIPTLSPEFIRSMTNPQPEPSSPRDNLLGQRSPIHSASPSFVRSMAEAYHVQSGISPRQVLEPRSPVSKLSPPFMSNLSALYQQSSKSPRQHGERRSPLPTVSPPVVRDISEFSQRSEQQSPSNRSPSRPRISEMYQLGIRAPLRLSPEQARSPNSSSFIRVVPISPEQESSGNRLSLFLTRPQTENSPHSPPNPFLFQNRSNIVQEITDNLQGVSLADRAPLQLLQPSPPSSSNQAGAGRRRSSSLASADDPNRSPIVNQYGVPQPENDENDPFNQSCQPQ